MILDRFSAEIFINDGEQVYVGCHIYRTRGKRDFLFVEGAAKIDVVKYDLVLEKYMIKLYIEFEDEWIMIGDSWKRDPFVV